MLKSTLCILSLIFLCSFTSSAQEKTDDSKLVKQLLTEDLGSRSFLFSQVVESTSGKKVIPFNKQNSIHKTAVDQIKLAIQSSIETLNKADSPIKKLRRINEATRYFENLLITEIAKHPDLNCSIPKNKKGNTQRTGYPDIRIEHTPSKTVFYLDPKLFEKKSKTSSLRTFYFEPKTRTMKILDDAVHLLIGISHDGTNGNWTFTGWKIVDLSKFKVRLKAEFQASNKDLYRKENLIESSK